MIEYDGLDRRSRGGAHDIVRHSRRGHVTLPRTSPRRPTPNTGAAKQAVTITRLGPTAEVIPASHVHHLRLVAVAIEHLCAPRKKGRVGDDVVFEHNRLGDML